MSIRWARVVWVAAIPLLLAGCGPKLAEVKGQVLSQGKPIPRGAMILFTDPDKGIFITAKLDQDGNYRVEMAEGFGLPPGSYGVAVLPPQLGKASPEVMEKYRKGGPPPELVAFPSIPLRYRKHETSGLRLDLPAAGAVFDVNLAAE